MVKGKMCCGPEVQQKGRYGRMLRRGKVSEGSEETLGRIAEGERGGLSRAKETLGS